MGRNERAEAFAREALALARRTGDQFEITHVLATLGSIALASEKEDEASAYYTGSYAMTKRADDAEDARPIGLCPAEPRRVGAQTRGTCTCHRVVGRSFRQDACP
ncbi:hypothetical protein [Dictyobacter formicarum]|uniref:hypothetical protein n=1 Tax=Dictyobacter formicarum TaxID=2778368 RepID=UPI003571673D